MKIAKFIPILFIILVLTNNLISQTIFVSGDINSNTIWSADTVKITGDINVAQGVILTVEPGTYVETQGYFKINISGSIRAIGTIADTIIFTVRDSTNFWQDSTSFSGGWAGFNLSNSNLSSDSSVFEFCKIQYGKKFGVPGDGVKGGAIFASDYGTLIIRNSLLNFNMVICYTSGGDPASGGAVYCKKVNQVIFEKNRFERNRSFSNGGAIYINTDCHTFISNNYFLNNWAISWLYSPPYIFVSGSGAAIFSTDDLGPSPIISNNQFFNNQSSGGIIVTTNRHGLIFNNVICNNEGPGIMDGHQLSTTRIFNNTIVNNHTFLGGILLMSKANVYNNICWGNEINPGNYDDQIRFQAGFSYPNLFYNCVQYGDGGTNSTNEYPVFKHPSSGVGLAYNGSEADWSLSDLSPCVNRGTLDTTGLYIPGYDILGNDRIFGVRIEIGCYENQSVLTDFDDDNTNAVHPIVYPNPGADRINIESAETELIFELITLTGQIIISERMDKGLNIFNTEYLSTGTYLYRLLNLKQQIVEFGKWIKK